MNLPTDGMPPASTKASHGTPTSAQAPERLRSRAGTGTSVASAIAGTVQRTMTGGPTDTTIAIVAAAPALHASTAAFPIAFAAAAAHIVKNASVTSVGSHAIHGRTARSSVVGRRMVAVTPLRHRSRPFQRVISAHVSYFSTASIAT